MEIKIINRILADATLSGIVGSKVRPNFASASDMVPYVIVRRISGGRYNTLTGGGTSSDSLVQVDLIGTSYSQVKTMAAACVASLNGWSNTDDAPKIYMVHLDNEADDDFSPTDGGDYVYHRVIQDYIVSFDTGA